MKRKGSKLVKKSKRKLVSLPKSDDSGVSLESSKDLEMPGPDLVNNIDTIHRESEGSNNNFRISIDLRNNRIVQNDSGYQETTINETSKCDQHNMALLSDDPRSDKSQFSFEDDVNSMLDYEPEEHDPEDYVDSASPASITEGTLFSKEPEVHLVDLNSSSEAYKESETTWEYSSDKVVEKLCDLRNSMLNSNTAMINQKEPVERVENNLNENTGSGESYKSDSVNNLDEVSSSYKDESLNHEVVPNLFKNAQFNFKGSLNITITKPVFNKESQNSKCPNSISETVNNIEYNSHKRHTDVETSKQKRTWPQDKTELELMKITSQDDIFLYNIKDLWKKASVRTAFSECSQSIMSFQDHILENPSNQDKVTDNIISNNFYESDQIQSGIGNIGSSAIGSNNSHCDLYSNMDDESVLSFDNPNIGVMERQESSDRETSSIFSGIHDIQPLKRPPTGPMNNDKILCERLLEDDAISIGMSSILDVESNFSEPLHSEAQESDTDDYVTRWLMQTDNIEVNLRQCLENLCESHFTTECRDSRCNKSHQIADIEENIKELPPEKLMEFYKLSQEHTFWYLCLFDIFIECFKMSTEMNRVMLVDMVNDVFVVLNRTFTDKTSYILQIIKALENTGLEFREAIDLIIVRHGTSHISICDILLFIIGEYPDLEKNWFLIKKITSCRREMIDHEVVVKLLNVALNNYPPKKDLCRNISNDIFEKNLVDSSKIPTSLMTSMRILLKLPTVCANDNLTTEENTVNSYNTFEGRNSSNYDVRKDNFIPERNCLLPECSSRSNNILNSEHQLYYPKNIRNTDDAFSPYSDDIIQSNSPFNRPMRRDQADWLGTQMNSAMIEIRSDSNLIHAMQTPEQNVFKVPLECAPRRRTRLQTCGREPTNRDLQQESTCPSRIVYNDNVLRKINKSLQSFSRPQTPANIVAHPLRQITVNPDFECNISLHNLYPMVQVCATEISNVDLLKLQKILGSNDGLEFLNVLDEYRDSFTIENFIVNTLTFITSTKVATDIFRKFSSLLTAIEKVQRNWTDVPHIKMLIEVLAMNVVYSLENKGEWKRCRDILLRVKNIHSVVTSKIFFSRSHLMSHMHRYIYIVRIFIRAEDFHWANEIFQWQVPNLLESPSKWPFQFVQSDLQMRNETLKLFFEEGFALNIVAANDLLKHIKVVLGGNVEGLNVWNLFDNFMCTMMDAGEEKRATLELLYRHIVNDYGLYMANEVLQGYLGYMEESIHYNDAFKLFRICCEKGVYHKYTGKERIIIIKTTMSNFEITCILDSYFENIVKRTVQPQDFYIELKLPQSDQPRSGPHILKNRLNRSIFAIFTSILHILRIKYGIIIEQSVESKIFVSRKLQEPLLII
ncbi:hypothetical protein HHI36_016104 [Cryptolaemus montrouzieri]|uniref:Uncharacterized protein n=1 Tax=Cryptolaemus montrouzieri TaxID=559131 RepID=A0ABD2NIN3_9CUCU